MRRTLTKALATVALSAGLSGLALTPALAEPATPAPIATTPGTQSGSSSGSSKVLALPLAFLAFPVCYNDSTDPNYDPGPLCKFMLGLYGGSASLLP